MCCGCILLGSTLRDWDNAPSEAASSRVTVKGAVLHKSAAMHWPLPASVIAIRAVSDESTAPAC